MIPLLYTAVVLCSISQSTLNKFNKGGDAIRFNFFKGLAACLVFFAAYLISREGFHLPTLLYGAAHGVLLAIANQAGYKALHSGPMALTSMVANFSLIIPFTYGVVFLREKPSPLAYVGLALLLTALVFLNLRRRGGEDKRQEQSAKPCALVAEEQEARGPIGMTQGLTHYVVHGKGVEGEKAVLLSADKYVAVDGGAEYP